MIGNVRKLQEMLGNVRKYLKMNGNGNMQSIIHISISNRLKRRKQYYKIKCRQEVTNKKEMRRSYNAYVYLQLVKRLKIRRWTTFLGIFGHVFRESCTESFESLWRIFKTFLLEYQNLKIGTPNSLVASPRLINAIKNQRRFCGISKTFFYNGSNFNIKHNTYFF